MLDEADYIIIGQGIAGTVLAHHFLKRNKKILVIDDADGESASHVSAGMINPVNFRRIVPVWKASEKLSCLRQTYREMERLTGTSFFGSHPFYRLFQNKEEQQKWKQKAEGQELDEFIEPADLQLDFENIHAPYGGGRVKNTGFVDTSSMLMAFREHLKKKNSFLQDSFDEDLMEITDGGIRYGSCKAKKIIFCTGYQSSRLSFFPDKAIRPLKGELLHLSIEGLPDDIIFSSGFYLLPKGNDKYIAGASYERGVTDRTVSGNRRAELIEKVRRIVPEGKIEVLAQYAGIRPTVPDHKALIGIHPEHPEIAFLNGLGTRGVMIAPLMAMYLTAFLEDQDQIPELVDINRFY